jgi:hypothetical protein
MTIPIANARLWEDVDDSKESVGDGEEQSTASEPKCIRYVR